MRAGRVAIGWSIFSNKKPVSCMSERVFGPIALAGFVKRPQADDQIGATYEHIVRHPRRPRKGAAIGDPRSRRAANVIEADRALALVERHAPDVAHVEGVAARGSDRGEGAARIDLPRRRDRLDT